MYSAEKTWTISDTKVTMKRSITVRPSMWIPKLVVVPPNLNQRNRSREAVGRIRSSPSPIGERWIQATAVRIDNTKEAPTAAIPSSEPFRGNRLPRRRMMTNEAVGMAGMTHALSRNQCTAGSTLHQVDLVEIDRVTVAVDEQDDGETDTDLRRRDRDDEEGEDLAGDVVVEGPECDQVDVDGVEDELNRHQHCDAVLPG